MSTVGKKSISSIDNYKLDKYTLDNYVIDGPQTGLKWSDNFNRADGTLGSNWTVDAGTWGVFSNAARQTVNANGNVYYNGATFLNASVRARIKVFPITGENWGVLARRTAANTYYMAIWGKGATDSIALYKVVGGTSTQLGSSVPQNMQVDDVLRLDANGSSIKVFVNGVEKISVTDTTIATAGYCGMRATYSATQNIRIDDFEIA